MEKREAVLTFRVESTCTFNDTFFKATDEEGGELHQFPAELIFDVPQHFSAVRGGWTHPGPDGERRLVDTGPDDEVNAKREAYFEAFLAINSDPSKTESQRHAESAVLKENFTKYGTAKAPEVPTGPKAPEAMSKDELVAALTELKAEFDPKLKKADLVVLLVAAQAKAEEDEE